MKSRREDTGWERYYEILFNLRNIHCLAYPLLELTKLFMKAANYLQLGTNK
jgi:hypothetical protein